MATNFAETFIVLDEMQVSWKRKIDGDLHLKSELFCRRPPVCRELPISNILWSLLTSHLLHKSNYSSTISLCSCPSILMTYKYIFIGAGLELEWSWTIFLVVVFSQLKFPRMSVPCHRSFQNAWLTCHNIIFSRLAHIKIFSHLAHIKLFSH